MKPYRIIRHFTELGTHLQQERTSQGITQRALADELGYSSAQFISNFERGISAPPAKKLKYLIKRLRLSKELTVKLLLAGEAKRIHEQLK